MLLLSLFLGHSYKAGKPTSNRTSISGRLPLVDLPEPGAGRFRKKSRLTGIELAADRCSGLSRRPIEHQRETVNGFKSALVPTEILQKREESCRFVYALEAFLKTAMNPRQSHYSTSLSRRQWLEAEKSLESKSLHPNIRFDPHFNNRITRTYLMGPPRCAASAHHANEGWQH